MTETTRTADSTPTGVSSPTVTTEIASLRRSPGGRIGVTGGAEFLRRMLGHGLIDELRVITHPVTLGHGRSPWPAGLRLHLTSAREFDSGANLRIYTTAV
jgi:dihydrofolate reductase